MRPIIKVEKLGKRYLIGEREPYRTIRESITRAVAAPWRGLRARLAGGSNVREANHVWALSDVSFEVMPGEVLGVIGRNGAGKSTLLKVLSRITEPTTGRAELYGRVGSLLEVGTGFHPELTGRENIRLSGAIMGMRRAEITRKFDQIVDFAEIERFVDTPVKRYSSGMYVRLAFAVAAHLDPEILLVDEVLAVGDASFQKKCLGKIGEVARAGRTVIFVSHNMASIESLCTVCLMLSGGRMVSDGATAKVIEHYIASDISNDSGESSLIGHSGRLSNSFPTMTVVRLCSKPGEPTSLLQIGSPLSVEVAFRAARPLRPTLGLRVKTAQGTPVFGVSNRWTHAGADAPPVSEGVISCDFMSLPLMPGRYSVDLHFGDFADITRDLDVVLDAASFEVYPTDIFGTGLLPTALDGPVIWQASWTVRDCNA
jgi:homopolymeric O-antigen transport system ATP-binding protein